MKLYNKTEVYTPNISIEQFLNNYKHSAVISVESVDMFFAKIKDKFSTATTSEDPYVAEVLSNKRAAILRSQNVKFQNFSPTVISKQETFSGYYSDYLQDLGEVVLTVDATTNELLDTLKMTLGTFINEYSDSKIDAIYGQPVYTSAEKNLPASKSKIASYFKAPAGKFKTTVRDVVKNMADIEKLFLSTENIAKNIHNRKTKDIQVKTKEVSELIDTLISVNAKSGILNKSIPYKQQLVAAIHVTAEYVEFHHALLANWVFYTKAFKELTTALVDFPTQ